MGVGFVALFPITFIASTFVPVASMPGVLRTVAEWNPITTLADASRQLFGNPNTPIQPDDPWSISNPGTYTALWVVGIIVVCFPIAVRAYKHSPRGLVHPEGPQPIKPTGSHCCLVSLGPRR